MGSLHHPAVKPKYMKQEHRFLIYHTQMGKRLLGHNESLLPNKKQNQHLVQKGMNGINSYATRTDALYVGRSSSKVSYFFSREWKQIETSKLLEETWLFFRLSEAK